jgi:Pentapeptide repeats (8 copies)
LSATALQTWVGALATLVGAITAVYLAYKNKRERIATVGTSFKETVEALSADSDVKQMAAAVLLRRFFDRDSEQAVRGVGALYRRGTPYKQEAIEVIAGMLRETAPSTLQKVLADGLRYAQDLSRADLQKCELSNAYLGRKDGDTASLNLSHADLYLAVCKGTSFKAATAFKSIFYRADLENAVLTEADCTAADFRNANLSNAKFLGSELRDADFRGATISGAKFAGATNIPADVTRFLDTDGVAAPNSVVPE